MYYKAVIKDHISECL